MKANKAPTNKPLAVITCECGKEILIVPDLKAMSQALNAHIHEHCKNLSDPQKADSEANRLLDMLTASLINAINQENFLVQ
jgi:hypothetical protein